jgi:hypothetical protein
MIDERDFTDAAHELERLWIDVFGEPPFIKADAKVLAKVLVTALPAAPPYKLDARPWLQDVGSSSAPSVLRDPSGQQ